MTEVLKHVYFKHVYLSNHTLLVISSMLCLLGKSKAVTAIVANEEWYLL